MSYTDFIILIIVVVIIIAIVVLNINSLIDKKLSNIAVNIPPISIPTPQVTVKVQKSCTNDDYIVYLDKEGGTQNQQIVTMSPIDDINNVNNENTAEHFGSISNVNEESKPLQIPQNSINIIPKYISTDNTTESNIKFPDDDEIVEYGNYKCTRNPKIEVKPVLPPKEKCGNQSLNNLKDDAYGYMAFNSKGINDYNFPLCSNYERNLIGDNSNETNDINITELYRKSQTFIKAYLEDPVVRGYNMDTYESYSPLFTSGKIPINKEVNVPKPNGYIFQNSPAYER
jgi:hypothetical protein